MSSAKKRRRDDGATAPRPRVALLCTGGTIASTGDDSLDLYDYSGPLLDAHALLARIPEVERSFSVQCVPLPFVPKGSEELGPREWIAISRAVATAAADGVDGVVCTHGTATLEETAYFLSLTLAGVEVPVVVVGSQRPITGLSTECAPPVTNSRNRPHALERYLHNRPYCVAFAAGRSTCYRLSGWRRAPPRAA